MSVDINKRRLRAGIIGGGAGAFIGAVHRIACELDGQALVDRHRRCRHCYWHRLHLARSAKGLLH